MYKKHFFVLLSVFIAILAIYKVVNANWISGKVIKGNGHVTTAKRSVEDFSQIEIDGSMKVVITNGKEPNIIISADSNIIPYIVTQVDHGDLEITIQKDISIHSTHPIIVTVSASEIAQLAQNGSGEVIAENVYANNFQLTKNGSSSMELNGKIHLHSLLMDGSGDIKIQGITTDQLDITKTGAGTVELAGKAAAIAIHQTGSGNVCAYDLRTKNASLHIVGSGNAYLSVTDNLEATIMGSSTVYYRGNPGNIKEKVFGNGALKKAV